MFNQILWFCTHSFLKVYKQEFSHVSERLDKLSNNSFSSLYKNIIFNIPYNLHVYERKRFNIRRITDMNSA